MSPAKRAERAREKQLRINLASMALAWANVAKLDATPLVAAETLAFCAQQLCCALDIPGAVSERRATPPKKNPRPSAQSVVKK